MILRSISIFCIFLLGFAGPVFSISQEETTQVRMVINLMDYISKDYVMAVKDGEIINEFEYAEMQEFAADAQSYYQKLTDQNTISKTDNLTAGFADLNALILEKASPAEVAAQAGMLRDAFVEMKLVSLAPNKWPNLENGHNLFQAQCASCHGTEGMGDGPAGAALEPSPTNFHDQEVINNISPLQAFNTITLGIEGTAMVSYNHLSQEEIWDLAFYVLSLQHKGQSTEQANNLDLESIATLSNHKLKAQNPEIDLVAVRTKAPASKEDALSIARNYLSMSEQAASANDFEKAKSLALKAYLEGVEPIEPKIKASDNKLFEELESSMLDVRAILKPGSNAKEVETAFAKANATLDQAGEVLGATNRGMLMTAGIALTILLREGLEAFFVILAILSILQSMGAKRATRWVHGGWITAVLIGIGGWFFADALLKFDAQSRELMEGLIALFAVGVLLYLGFWMHGHSNAAKWKAFVAEKVQGLLSKNNMIGLAAFSFLVVFREAFESVLFLSSLTIDGESDSSMGVLIGSIASAVLLFGIGWAMLKWFKKLPIGKVFLYSSMVILALAFVLAGNGIHAIQEGGYLDIRSFPLNLKLSWIGLYPTWETILVQALVLGLIAFLWSYSNKRVAKA